MLEDPGGVEPLGARIKSPLPNHLRLERSGSISDGDTAASRPGFLIVVVMLVSCCLVLPHGNDPRSSGYRPGALPLSYGRVDWCFVADSNRGSPACRAGALAAKLTNRLWCSLQDSNLGMSVCRTDAFAAWRSELSAQGWCGGYAQTRMVHPGGLEPPCLCGGRF